MAFAADHPNYRSLAGDLSSNGDSEGGQRFGLPCSSTTSDFEPAGRICKDFRNSMTSFCCSADKASKARLSFRASPLCASTASRAVVNLPWCMNAPP